MSIINDKLISDLIIRVNEKILTDENFTFESDHDMTIKLSDQVILYNNGTDWQVVPLLVSLSYPIIYDYYQFEENKYDISLVVCPISLTATIFKGKFKFETYVDNIMILRDIDTDELIPINSNYKLNNQTENFTNKRIEVKIITLRNAIIFAPDPKYMILNKNIKLSPILDIHYYSNNVDLNNNEFNSLIHPKTLVYVVQYKSYNLEENKTSILLGKDVNKSEVTGYDFRKSKMYDYLKKINTKILNREGYILPCLWYVAKSVYPSARLIYID